ncbi:MAG: glycoside hydrolase family 3 N-terminal domain-containing protein [Candidatus Borkfalkiaceae bacterium]|nr:glycoside hydrolase family 3 N-terminal domain-containing protein [Christensenellaceae bacterium]
MNRIQEFARHCRNVISEGIVMLETDGALPLVDGESVALLGRGQFEYVKSGTGSGGRVNCDYVTNIGDELEKRVKLDEEAREFYRSYIKENPYEIGDGWRGVPSQKQPELSVEFVKRLAARNEKAIFIISRSRGEGGDCTEEKGDWYLSEDEESNLALLSAYMKHVIVLINSGNIIDMSWVKRYRIGTVAYIWQGGQEGGIGTVDTLMGDVPPSGRLTDTIATEISDYPAYDCWGDEVKNVHKEDIYVGYRYFETFAQDKVLYPFGYGLSYTEFEQKTGKAEKIGEEIRLSVEVKNVGKRAGKDVVQVYFSYPNALLGAPERQLIAFQKTRLLQAGESQTCEFVLSIDDMAAYDDSGVTGFPHSYVLEQGEYGVYAGKNVRDAEKAVCFRLGETRIVRKCEQALAPREAFERLTGKGYEPTPLASYSLEERIQNNLPASIGLTGDRGIALQDVRAGKNTLDEFIAQFDEKALMQIVRGEGMCSLKAPVPGTASCFGGTASVWHKKGVPVITTSDGPSGIRMESGLRATCIPSGMLIACTWNPEALNGVFDGFAEEMLDYGIDVILAPGINIHRHPLCGRNFEYFSEDPYLSGVFARKIAERFAKKGGYCTLKHFAVNSQEKNRVTENEVVSERALREIYLRPFEISVRSGYPKAIMTSYNRINGRSAAGNYDLTTTILRKEWGYQGLVMTDWWTWIDDKDMQSQSCGNLTEMVKAQNDVYMVVDDAVTNKDDMAGSFTKGYLTLGELQRCAKNILEFVMSTVTFRENKMTDFSDLSAATELIASYSLEELPFETCAPEDSWMFAGRQVRKLCVRTPEDGLYCGEIEYRIDDEVSVQKRYGFCIDAHEMTTIVCNGTNGAVGKKRTKIYLKKESSIVFDSADISGFSIYKL